MIRMSKFHNLNDKLSDQNKMKKLFFYNNKMKKT